MVRGWWSASNIILLWSGVGGQVRTRSLEGPFRNAFGNTRKGKQRPHDPHELYRPFQTAMVCLRKNVYVPTSWGDS